MKKTTLTLTVAMAAMMAVPAAASTVTIADGATFCESKNLSAFGNADCDQKISNRYDLPNQSSNAKALAFAGTGTLAGFVADGAGTNNGLFPDFAMITLNQASRLTLTLVSPDAKFDALFTFGDLVSTYVSDLATTYTFEADAGTYLFGLDASEGFDSATKIGSSYALEVAEVPLPAGAVLLLTGLGGLAFARRKQSA